MLLLDELVGRGRGHRAEASLALFAQGLWVREDSLREVLTWLVSGVQSALNAVPIEPVPEGLEQEEGWERAHWLSRHSLRLKDRLFQLFGSRLHAHARSLGSQVTGTDLADSALTAMFANALGSSSALDDEVLDAIAVGFGLSEPGLAVLSVDRDAVASALDAKPVALDLVEVLAKTPYAKLLSRRDQLREIQRLLTEHLSDPDMPRHVIETLLELMVQPYAFAFLCTQSLAVHSQTD